MSSEVVHKPHEQRIHESVFDTLSRPLVGRDSERSPAESVKIESHFNKSPLLRRTNGMAKNSGARKESMHTSLGIILARNSIFILNMQR